MPLSRRDALKAFALPALAGVAGAGCSGGRGVRVAVVWSGWELTQFHRVLDAFSERTGLGVSVLSAGDDIGALLGNRVAGTATPDVALIPRPGLVRQHRDQLVPLRPAPADPSPWEKLLVDDGRVYGNWFKVAHKSMVWYRPELLGAAPQQWDWDTWREQCRALARAGRPPLSVGAADGWVLTDWFENVLLSVDPVVYRGLVVSSADPVGYRRLGAGSVTWRHPSVATALRRLGEIWSIPGVFPGGPERALLTQFDESLLEVFEHGRAAMVVSADFAWPFIVQYSSFPPSQVRWVRFPHKPNESQPVVVGGDAAVLLRESGRSLVDWLGSAPAAEIWARSGGFLSINERVTGYPAEMEPAYLAAEVRTGSAGDVTFDLSDQLEHQLAGGESRGTWRILKDFFVEVGNRPAAVEKAVGRAVDAFDRAAKGLSSA